MDRDRTPRSRRWSPRRRYRSSRRCLRIRRRCRRIVARDDPVDHRWLSRNGCPGSTDRRIPRTRRSSRNREPPRTSIDPPRGCCRRRNKRCWCCCRRQRLSSVPEFVADFGVTPCLVPASSRKHLSRVARVSGSVMSRRAE
ncbi:uncharacterized protein LOC143153478 [Ptiloglossa arizonensis]|uniref:uncharacterized protein LOC143153478 n=1 Tax=Ptiloglossa arizonensis TaxID=3350558 RepID=UPI003F9FAFBA